MFRYKLTVLAVLSILLMAGCQPVSVEEAQAQLCTQLTEFHAAMGALDAINADSTVDEAEAALKVVGDEWDDVVSSAYTVSDAKTENLEQAYEDLDDAIRDVSQGDTIQGAAASLQDEVANVNAAYDEVFAANCPPATQ
jgi:outer membrane murein-binding lipoprotein Lpp